VNRAPRRLSSERRPPRRSAANAAPPQGKLYQLKVVFIAISTRVAIDPILDEFRRGSVVLANLNSSVLVVDDYSTMRRIIRNLLTQIGFTNVDEASDGADALRKLREKSFGLVISDWNMEPMTGLQLLQEVRADAKLKPMPFIMVTAESKTENVVAAKQAGVNNYIVKPFNAETLKKKIESVLGPL